MTRSQEITANLKKINAIAQSKKPSMASADNLGLTLGLITFASAIAGIVIIAKIAGL